MMTINENCGNPRNNIYNSDGILAMLEEAENLPMDDDKKTMLFKHNYYNKYVIDTPFSTHLIITVIIKFFKSQIDIIRKNKLNEYAKNVLENLKRIANAGKENFDDVVSMYAIIHERYNAQRYTFIAYLKNKTDYSFYDLLEDGIKEITIEKCSLCNKENPPLLCQECKQAAYCNDQCLKKEISFHKKHCKILSHLK